MCIPGRPVRVALGLLLVGGLIPAITVESASAGVVSEPATQVKVSPGAAVRVAGSAKFLDGSAESTVSVPSLQVGTGLYVASQLRSAGEDGYRAKVQVESNGKLTGFLTKKQNGNPESVFAAKALGVTVQAGSSIHIEFAISGTSPVSLKMRAWGSGAKPDWQLTASDSSSTRVTTSGVPAVRMYLPDSAPAAITSSVQITSTSSEISTPGAPPAQEEPAAPPVDPAPSISGAGAPALGSTSYSVPAGAIIVSPSGSDSNNGKTTATPVKTIARALSLVPANGTVVLRAGGYHESVMMPGNKAVTIQSYPKEAAWLDGSREVSGFVKSGNTWVLSGWTTKFDSSPTYTRGAADGTATNWQFINPNYPMAAHPDQVWINGSPLQQVKSQSLVGPGTFYVDYSASKLIIGSDPSGKTVRASDLIVGMTVTSPGTVVRGIAIRRFAPSVPDKGALRIYANNTTIENVEVSDSATQGISLKAANVTFRHVTSSNNGLNGLEVNQSDNLVLDSVRAEGDNREHFNSTPVSAGIKVTSSRGVTIKNSVFSNNYANGIWFDMSCYDVTVVNNDVIGNSTDGVILELTEKLYVVNNRIVNNGEQALFLLDTGRARIWNNTVTGSLIPVRIHDSARIASNTSSAPYAYDPRRPKPDPTVTWMVYDVQFSNNVVGDMRGGWCGVLCVLTDTGIRTASQMVTLNGNVYQRKSASDPATLIRWATGKTTKAEYKTLAAFKSGTGQEPRGAEVLGSLPSTLPAAGVGVPADVASTLGVSTGTVLVGARR